MANFDASSPQLRTMKKWIENLVSLDMTKVEPLISRNFKYLSFPKTIDLPDQTKEAYIQWFGGLMALIAKPEVRIQRWRTHLQAWRLIYTPRRPFTKWLKHRGK
jgi:hypothetical protein